MHIPTDSQNSPLVLIVEDSRVARAELRRAICEVLGFRVAAASTYEEAREYLNRHAREVFLAILDLNLPDAADGQIVDLFCSKAVPCLVLTADVTAETRERMLSKEIIDYIVKDVRAVENVLGYLRRLYRNQGHRVMVVEDSESFRLYLCTLLNRHMFKVEDFSSSEAALDYLDRHDDISMVVIDYVLPNMDGIELTRKIRDRRPKEDLVVIGLSSIADTILAARYIKSGANDFISKPLELEVFNRRINHHVEVLESIRALRKANDVKNQFLGMVVHDLRSPINGIKGLTDMLMGGMLGELNDEQQEMIGDIGAANRQMNDLVSDLLDISVIESGRLNLVKAEANICEVIDQRLRIQGFEAQKKLLEFKQESCSLQAFSFDANRIGQVLDNLLSNAIKFSPLGAEIAITLEREGDEVLICIKDQGQGIPPEEAELLFKSFQKTSVRPTGGESSTGLGLPIVKKIVEAHGGRVWAESDYGQGATFCFSLPVL